MTEYVSLTHKNDYEIRFRTESRDEYRTNVFWQELIFQSQTAAKTLFLLLKAVLKKRLVLVALSKIISALYVARIFLFVVTQRANTTQINYAFQLLMSQPMSMNGVLLLFPLKRQQELLKIII